MFESSKDILYVVLSFCILWVTVFLCWMFYYAGKILKDAARIVEEFRMRLQLLTETINYVRGKVENISSLLTLATSGAAGLVKKVMNKKIDEWSEGGAEKMNEASEKVNEYAKEAVDKAVAATAKEMNKMSKNIRNM